MSTFQTHPGANRALFLNRTARMFGAPASALLLLLALPPFGLWPLALVVLMPLLCGVMQLSAPAAFGAGALFGAATGASVYFGAAVLDPLTWLAASASLMLGCAVFAVGASRLANETRWPAAALVGASWASMEMIFDALGLPFSLALALSESPALLQAASLGGQWLVVFVLVATQYSLVRAGLGLQPWRNVVAWCVVAVGCTLAGTWHTVAVSGQLTVAAMQTRLHPFDYIHTEADGQLEALAAARGRLLESLVQDPQFADAKPEQSVELIAWPEVVFARFEARAPQPAWPVIGVAQLIAGNDLTADGRQFNAVFAVDARGAAVSRHVKSRLLPRLEKQYATTLKVQPHATLPGTPGSLICYESAFSDIARRLTVAGAGLLVVATSDAFAGPSALPWLHAAYSPLRAIENRRSVVRAANGGPSVLVGPDGRTRARAPVFVEGVVRARLPLAQELTLFSRHADAVRTLLGILGALAVGLALWRPEPPNRRDGATARSALVALCVFVAHTAGSALLASHAFQAHVATASGWAGFGFSAHRRFETSYRELTSTVEADDFDGALAALMRRFGQPATRASVQASRETLARTSVFETDAAMLLDHYGFLHHDLRDATFSDTPCVVTLRDRRTVVVTRRSPQAAEVFLPGQGEVLSVPREWLEQRASGGARCVIGRAYPWDLLSD